MPDDAIVTTPEVDPATSILTQEFDASTAQQEPEVPDTPEQAEEKKRESAKERRDRDKAAKQRVREELAITQKKLQDAEERLSRVDALSKSSVAPKEADFTDYAEYVAALSVYRLEQNGAKRETQQVTAEADAAKAEAARLQGQEDGILWNNWQAQSEAAKERYGDFDAVIKGGVFPEGSAILSMVLRSDTPADLAYHIANDKALNMQLMAMPPIEAARLIGRLEAGLSQPKPRTATQAPSPISPLRGTVGAARDPASMSYEEYKAARKAGKL
jgi:hypothetical protein